MSLNKNHNGLPDLMHSSPAWVLALLLCGVFLSGCRHLQLPAIDPNGRCIFLPKPATTQLAVPPLHSTADQTGFLPQAAFTTPPPPPACTDACCEPTGVCNLFHRKHDCLNKIHDHFRSKGKAGEIQLTPLRVVAPVGGEVVFLAGVCGQDNFLVKQEPIEWMLSPDSVGQIIQVSDEAPGKLSGFLHPNRPKVEKLGVDFARGRTSSKAQIIDRGTPDCNDDIHLRDGETWVSLSSPTAGVSRLTVLAPDSKLWDQRRLTAVVYWLDAQWQFPGPQIAATGNSLQLSTRVTKSEGFVPATDWLVQYTIVDPKVAQFVSPTAAAQGSHQVRVRVDENAMAVAQLAAPPEGRGTTPVLIEVISPAQPADHLPEIVVGRGETFVTFSSPGLNVQAFGPSAGMIGDQLNFVASLGNPGDLNADNTRLTLNLPVGLRLVAASPQPTSQTETGAVWDQGVLAANRQLDVTATVQAVQQGTYDVVFQAEATGLSSRSSVRTEIGEASVEVRFAPAGGVSEGEVGSTVQYEIDIRNTGRQTLTNLKLSVETDPGLAEATQGTFSVNQVISSLQPGETRSLGIPFQIRQEGQHNARLRILSAGDNLLTERTATILGRPARPKTPNVGVEIQFPWSETQTASRMSVGGTRRALITLRNAGQVRLSGLSVELTVDGSTLEFTGVDINSRPSTRADSNARIVWTPADMLSGQGGDVIRQLWVNVRARSPSQSATISVRATAAEGVTAQAAAQTQVIAADNVAPPVLPSPQGEATTPPSGQSGPGPSNGQLRISINHFNDPTIVGKEIRYGVRIANQSNSPNRGVKVDILRPEGARLSNVSREGVEISPNYLPDRTVRLQNIEYMRPGEEIYYIVVLIPEIPQKMKVSARVYSNDIPNPVEATETTTVINPGS